MIDFNTVTKKFEGPDSIPVVAIEQLTLHISTTDFLVITGANGSGKSTFMNLLAGTLKPTQGSITINGTSIENLKEFERSKWIGRIFQNPLAGTASELSILENFRLAALRSKSKRLIIGIQKSFRDYVQSIVETLNLGLENKLNQNMGTLSGGQRQALTLLMATMDHVKLLLMDEPTSALDPKSAEIVMQLANHTIKHLKIPAVLITHNLKEAVAFGNRIVQFDKGKILRDLNSQEKATLRLEEVRAWFT
jgi:putative ABC transport system ATP-binding protein